MIKNRSIFISLIFIIVAFFSASVIYSVEINYEVDRDNNSFMSSNSISYSVSKDNKEIDEIVSKEYKNLLLNMKGKYTILADDGDYNSYGIYFNKKLKNVPKMIKGRFFKESDFNKNNKYVVIGKGLKENIIKKDGVDYFYIGVNKYKVIGIMGDDKRETPYDYSTFYNLDGFFSFKDSRVDLKYTIDISEKYAKNLDETIMSLSKDFVVNKLANAEEVNFKDYMKDSMGFIIEIVVMLILSTALVTEYWIKNRKREIGIKRALGATRLRIGIEIIGELISTSLISYIVGYLLYLIFFLIKDGYVNFYFSSVVVVFLITLLSSLLVSFVPIKESLKVQPREIMRLTI